MLEAEKIYREGTPVAAIDAAMRASIFPMGPFELGDQAGLDIAAGMFDTIAAQESLPFEPLVWKLRDAKRFGIKSGAGVYDYANRKKQDRELMLKIAERTANGTAIALLPIPSW